MSRTLTTAALTATLTIFSVTSAMAGAGNSLGDCYNHVISACNQTAHPIPCSTSGMDACDEEHASATSDPRNLNRLKASGEDTPVIALAPQRRLKL